MVAPLIRVGLGLAHAAYRHRDLASTSSGEDPRAIMADAMDPDVPAVDVLIRARARSRTGRLLRAVEERLAERPSVLSRIGSLFD